MRSWMFAALACLLFFKAPGADALVFTRLAREGLRPATMVEPAYSEADRAAGVQGDVTVRGAVQPDGAIAEVAVAESSRSPALDGAAAAAVRQWTFPSVEAPTPYEVRFEIRKDDLNTLADKTCADLNVDVAYFRRTFPELAPRDMPLKDVLVGMMMVVSPRGMSLDGIRRASDAFERTIDWCATHPTGLVLERYLRFAR